MENKRNHVATIYKAGNSYAFYTGGVYDDAHEIFDLASKTQVSGTTAYPVSASGANEYVHLLLYIEDAPDPGAFTVKIEYQEKEWLSPPNSDTGWPGVPGAWKTLHEQAVSAADIIPGKDAMRISVPETLVESHRLRLTLSGSEALPGEK
jgi:hypothetical protein